MLEAEDSSDEELDANDDPKEEIPTANEDVEDGYDEEESDEEVPTDQAELLKRIKQLKEVRIKHLCASILDTFFIESYYLALC